MGYISLKDLYAGCVQGITVKPLPRQQIYEQVTEADIVQPANFNPDQSYTQWVSWQSVNVSQSLFSISRASGEGRGEYSVASFLSGLQKKEQIDKLKLVKGGNYRYDVEVLNQGFEVKELQEKGEVRIGTEGIAHADEFKDSLRKQLSDLLKLYVTLTNIAQRELNGALSKQFQMPDFNLGTYLKAFHKQSDAVPASVISSEKVFVDKQSKLIPGQPALLWLLQTVQNLPVNQSMSQAKGVKNDRVQALLDLIGKKEMYGLGDKDVENKNNYYQDLEKAIEELDKELLSKRCSYSGNEEYCTTVDSFVNELQKKDFHGSVANIISNFKDHPEKIFPPELKGLFVVKGEGFMYICREDLPKYVTVTRITIGKPKIKLINI